jgi:hypothetical protein
MLTSAILLSQLLTATSGEISKKYGQCIVERTTHYAMYCYLIPDIVMAVRGKCRPTILETLDEKLLRLDPQSKGEIIRQYMWIMDEIIYQVAMDTRIEHKVDCGQFNAVSPKDGIDPTKKR